MQTAASRSQISQPAPGRGRMLTLERYIMTARILHWIVTVLTLAAIGLGLYGDGLPYGSGTASAQSTFVYALHKTIGVSALAVALPFAAWLFLSPGPPRHVRAGVLSGLWQISYWGLFFGMLLLPVTGSVLHSNGPSWGFAPIYLPIPPRVPGIPDSFSSNPVVEAFHRDSWWLFAALSLIHLVLYFKRRRDRRYARKESQPKPITAMPRALIGLFPILGLLMWVVVAVVDWLR